VPVPATKAPWTAPRPARRAPCSRAYHPALTPALLYWGGGTVGRFWTASDLPDKADVFIHGYKTSVTAISSRHARGGLRTHTAVSTTRAGRALHEDRRATHTVSLGAAPRDGRRAHDKVQVGGAPIEGRRVPHKAPLGGALLAGRRPGHEVPPGGALRDSRQALHTALRGGARPVAWRTTIGAWTAPSPPLTDVRVSTPLRVHEYQP